MIPEDLYQEIILDHNRRPRNRGSLGVATHAADGINPLCGDEVHVCFRLKGSRIEEARFHGQACAIATASASLLTEAIEGMGLDEARHLAEQVLEVLAAGHGQEDALPGGELKALEGVRRFPARAKCAGLAWRALIAAVEGTPQTTTEK